MLRSFFEVSGSGISFRSFRTCPNVPCLCHDHFVLVVCKTEIEIERADKAAIYRVDASRIPGP